jgi:hypothetical protein
MPNGIPVYMPAAEAFSGGVMVGSQTSQPDGTFDLAVPAGSYQVVLDYGGGTGDGYYSATAPGHFTFNKARATLVASTSDGGQGLMTIVQPALPQITGRMFDGNGKPLAHAYVFLYTAGSSAAPSMTTTDASGWFVANTAPGKYLMLVGGNGNIHGCRTGRPCWPAPDRVFAAGLVLAPRNGALHAEPGEGERDNRGPVRRTRPERDHPERGVHFRHGATAERQGPGRHSGRGP